ncbi:MAG: hypothetical protein WCX31_05430 [Salinivirgaceae bacterium]|jgi:hypothetical protein
MVEIQSLPDEDKNHILYTFDGLLQNLRTKQAFAKLNYLPHDAI